jgi:hypothetical protein
MPCGRQAGTVLGDSNPGASGGSPARMEGTGLVSAEEVARFLALAADGSSHDTPPFMVTAWGRRPPA